MSEVKAAGAWASPLGCTRPARPRGAGRGGKVATTDGPHLQAKEQFGFWIVEAADLDATLAWAKGSLACEAAAEVRPFQDEPARP